MDNQTPDNPAPADGEIEKTIIRPRPGLRTSSLGNMPVRAGAPTVSAEPLDAVVLAFGKNPLLAAAHSLLMVVTEIRRLPTVANPEGLKAQLSDAIKRFERDAQGRTVTRENIVAARYVLCTFADECAASTPWGGAGMWAKDTLLTRFHNETWGGEKVFQLLAKLAESPASNRDLLELIYVCISLGFEGRFRVIENGKSQLDLTRERLFQIITQAGAERPRNYALKWQPAAVTQRSWMSATPIWVVCAVLGLLTLGSFGTYKYLLASRSDPAFAAIQSIRLKPTLAPVVAAVKPRLAGFLEEEIRAGLVGVRDEATRSVVTLKGDKFFDPGSAAIDSAALPVIAKIAKALVSNPGAVLVQGHSDSIPIRSIRFPSNWELSKERAVSVSRLLAGVIEPARLRAEGLADSEPVGPNDTPVNRAKNRRVDITLFVQ